MLRKHFAGFPDRFDECAAEFFILEMPAHSINKVLPELFPALFVDSFITHHSELMRAGRNENEHSIALARFVHAKALKFFLRGNQCIGAQLAALTINPNLTGLFPSRF